MRSSTGLFDAAFSFPAMLAAWRQAARHKRRRPDVCAFETLLHERVLALSERLLAGAWRPGAYRRFPFEEHGKRRLICAAPFEDRVVHHAIVAVLEPLWERRFVGWSFANRKGLGTHAAMRHASEGVRRHRWCLQADVQRFFPSVDHAVLERLVSRHVSDPHLLAVIREVIASGAGLLTSEWKPVLFPGDDLLSLTRPKGLPIGNQTSQFFANVMLHPLDLCIAQQIRPGRAARYVDDFVLFDDDREKLVQARAVIDAKLAELRLVVHPRKTMLRPTSDGVTFVGYRLTREGIRLPRATVTRFRRRLRALAEDYANGAVDLRGAKQVVFGLLGHARAAHTTAALDQALNEFPLIRGQRREDPS